MTDFELMEAVAAALTNSKIDELASLLSPDCVYVSEYAKVRVLSADKIIKRLNAVDGNTVDNEYSYKMVSLDEILRDKEERTITVAEGERVLANAMLYYRYGEVLPVAVVSATVENETGLIKNILLSRDSDLYDTEFYDEDIDGDSLEDLPSTVDALTQDKREVQELRNAFSAQHLDRENIAANENIYIWRKADEYCKKWLPEQGYFIFESQIFEDCIGYRCRRKDINYTIYMYAFGRKQTSQLDGDYCSKFLDFEFSADSIVLVLYLQIKKLKISGEIQYRVCTYSGTDQGYHQLWRVTSVLNQPILEYYPRKEMIDVTFELMCAFNNDDLDIYDCIKIDKNAQFHDFKGTYMNGAELGCLLRRHKEYGDMKLGYVRFNDVIYSATPYLDGYGYFDFRVDNATNKIMEISVKPFEGAQNNVKEFVRTEESVFKTKYDHTPLLIKAEALPPVETERFALKLTFDDGMVKKYVLPVDSDEEQEEVVSWHHHVFTDKIWQSAHVEQQSKAEIEGYRARKPLVRFKNGFFLSGSRCYYEGTDYPEPNLCDELIYEDDNLLLKRLWRWAVESVYEDGETGLMKTLISGEAFNYNGKSTFASRKGKRLCSIDFDLIDSFSEGLAKVAVVDHGYGFIDEKMHFVIPMKYDLANRFHNGKARVQLDGRWFYIDKSGREVELTSSELDSRYQDVGEYSEGMCKVSTLKLRLLDFAYHTDYSEIAGTWGFVDEEGKEVIAPQYIYAEDFDKGMAFVCKGKWTIDKKWDNEYNTGKYWTEEELWGAIDKTGRTVIPFIFDDINHFMDNEEVFKAHIGGWDNGRWGVIDRNGKWVAEPIFEEIDDEYVDGLFAFYSENRCGDDVPMGIYDANNQKVAFEPQFFNVSFENDGWIKVGVFDNNLSRPVEKLIDLSGKEKFRSEYTWIYTWKHPNEVVIRDENGDRHGLIDETGQELLPCKYNIAWNGIAYEQKRIVFKENDKRGVMDFDGHIIIPAIYNEIYGVDAPFMTVVLEKDGDRNEGLVTHGGTVVLPIEYDRISWLKDHYIICCKKGGGCELLRTQIKDDASGQQSGTGVRTEIRD